MHKNPSVSGALPARSWLSRIVSNFLHKAIGTVVDEKLALAEENMDSKQLRVKLARMREVKNAYRKMADQAVKDMEFMHRRGAEYSFRRAPEVRAEFESIKDEE